MKTTIKVNKETAKQLKEIYPEDSYDFIIQKLMDYYITERKYLISSHGTSINLLFKFYPDDPTGNGRIEPYIKIDNDYEALRDHLVIREEKLLNNTEKLMLAVLYSLPLKQQVEEKLLNFNIGQTMTIGDDFEGYTITRVE